MSNKAYLYLIKLLSSRDYSEHKLREKLKKREFPANEIESALIEIKEKGYLREEAYAEARAKAFMNKGYSKEYIKQKLKSEHVIATDELITDLYSDYKNSESDQIKNLIEKKMRGKNLENYSDEVKLIRFALGKGHSMGAIKNVLKEYKKSTGQPPTDHDFYE